MADKKSFASIRQLARPFLPRAVEVAADAGKEPRDFFLVIPKYDPTRGSVAPRSLASEVVALAKTATQRAKMNELLALPCEAKQLLVIVTAGTHTEGALIPVVTLVPSSPRIFVTPDEMKALEREIARHGETLAAQVDKEGGRLADYVAILALPNGTPVILPRRDARRGLEIGGFADILKDLDAPATNADELLFVYKLRGNAYSSRAVFSPKP